MCGIVGYVGWRSAQEVLLEGLERLEYRGYDSAGIAVMEQEKIGVRKCAGRIGRLAALAQSKPLKGSAGIGHTRWATHGEPSDLNAHPHTDVMGDLALVHNGIIENHRALRSFLEDKGYRFLSQTDTEVAVHLLDYFHHGDLKEALQEGMNRMTGSYALAVLSEKEPETLYCLRRGSSLIIGMGEGEMFVASDIPAILPYTRKVLVLEDCSIAVIRAGEARVYDAWGMPLSLAWQEVNWDAAAAEKDGYPHFMLKEIMEQPRAVKGTLDAYWGKDDLAAMAPGNPSRLDLIACGTAYHAGCVGAFYFSHAAGMESRAHIASEYRYARHFPRAGEAAMAISQSGETADTLAALETAKKTGASLLALTNTVGSTLSRMAERTFLTYAGPEIAVASTKAYVTQVESLLLMALSWAAKKKMISSQRLKAMRAELEALPEKMERVLSGRAAIQHYCDCHLHEPLVFFIGRGVDYALAMEGALKLKEVSYLPCTAYPAGELKHGAIALIQEGTPVIAVCTQEELLGKTLSNLRETKARGAKTVCICPERFAAQAREEGDEVWTVPDADPWVLPMLSVLPMQLLAYHMAVAQGRDVDKPRNLAKSVTVE